MSRRSALGGVLTLTAFLALVWISAAWSPLGRGPVLDGLGPLAPYRWVDPPSDAPDDETPQGATFELAVDDEGSEPDVLFTPDDQVTLVMDQGAVGSAPGRRSVTIEVTPLDPATLSALPGDLRAFGNAVRIDVPEIERFDGQVDVVLLYPETITFHATRHEILWSVDGTDWRPLDTTDTRATQQAQAKLEAPGYVVVGAVPVPHPLAPASPPGTDGSEGSGTPILILVVGAVVLLAIGVVARRRSGRAG